MKKKEARKKGRGERVMRTGGARRTKRRGKVYKDPCWSNRFSRCQDDENPCSPRCVFAWMWGWTTVSVKRMKVTCGCLWKRYGICLLSSPEKHTHTNTHTHSSWISFSTVYTQAPLKLHLANSHHDITCRGGEKDWKRYEPGCLRVYAQHFLTYTTGKRKQLFVREGRWWEGSVFKLIQESVRWGRRYRWKSMKEAAWQHIEMGEYSTRVFFELC